MKIEKRDTLRNRIYHRMGILFMKLKTRIIVGFLMVILVPLLLFTAALYGFQRVQSQDTPQVNSNIVYDFSIENDADGGARVSLMAKDVLFSALVILVFTSLAVGLWIYRSVAIPLVKLKRAPHNIKEGNVDFVLDVEGDDECPELCQDFEVRRQRRK